MSKSAATRLSQMAIGAVFAANAVAQPKTETTPPPRPAYEAYMDAQLKSLVPAVPNPECLPEMRNAFYRNLSTQRQLFRTPGLLDDETAERLNDKGVSAVVFGCNLIHMMQNPSIPGTFTVRRNAPAPK